MTERLLPDRIELPGGGWVQFRDEDTLTGKDVFRVRAIIDARKSVGQLANDLLQVACEVLVVAWEIPGRPALPVPSVNPDMKPVELLPWKTLKAIERAVAPLANALRRDAADDDEPADTGPGSPTPPDSD